MNYKTRKQVSASKIIEVEIRLSDPCKNGHNDFAITGTVYEKNTQRGSLPWYVREDAITYKDRLWLFSSGGCIHDEITRYFPEFKTFVDLHLSNEQGMPMYAIENGNYHLSHNIEHAMSHFRASYDEMVQLRETRKVDPLAVAKYVTFMEPAWRKQAEQAKKQLQELINNQS